MSTPDIDFRQIRPHANSRNRAFEELAYQLIPGLDGVSPDEIVRHGTPDGGKEATHVRPDGSVWGWQAKYLFSFGSGELGQLDESFRTALSSTPSLVRYTFILPYDLPSGSPAGRAKSAQQRFDDAKLRWEALAAADGRTVDIRYVGESRLLALLTDASQAGRARYWFDTRVLSPEWLGEKTRVALEAAGPRYSPEINVELPVGFAFEALGRTRVFDEAFGARVVALRRSRTYLLPTGDSLRLTKKSRDALDKAYKALADFVAQVETLTVDGFGQLPWSEAIARARDLEQMVEDANDLLRKRGDVLRKQEARAKKSAQPHSYPQSEYVRSFASGVWRVTSALRDLTDLLESAAGQLVNNPRLFLLGDWGTGKTHLLCDVAQRRNARGEPTIIVLGQAVGSGAPWPQLLEQLGLSNLSAEEFLATLDVAAETAGKRALLMIDAINEGKGREVWPDALRSFMARVAEFPRIALVMSCRTNYLDAVMPREPVMATPENLGFVRIHHPGFGGEESRAMRRFFAHYGLALPDFPLLVPEFSNPLFLKLLCQALNARGQTTLPRGSSGFTFLFNEFLAATNSALSPAAKCDYRESENLVQRAASAAARAMLQRGEEWLPIEVAEALANELLPGRPWHSSLLHGLLAEGVLAQNRIAGEEVVHFGYQRLADHLRAAQLIDERELGDELESAVASLAQSPYAHAGLLEALAVLLPERRRIELHQLVSDPHVEVIEDAFIASLIWRDITAFPETLCLDYLNAIRARSYWGEDRILSALLQVACIPEHPFNAYLLHGNLSRRGLAERDAWWTTYINGSDPGDSIVYRVIDWGLSEEQVAAADDAALLCAMTLVWFFAASDRRLRDRATKALVNLMRTRLHLFPELLGRFKEVNDPYVAERLFASAYGSALACRDDQALRSLAATIVESVFADGAPPVHLLLRDYARGVIEVAVERGVISSDVLEVARPPYQSPWPVRAPTADRLEKLAASGDYSSLSSSLLVGLKDFAHYTVGHAVSNFMAPNQARRLREQRAAERREAAEKLETLEKSLSGPQRRLAEAISERSSSAGDAFDEFLDSLDDEQKRLFAQSTRHANRRYERITFPEDDAARWIFQRVLKLGWTPRRFGDYDRHRSGDFDRSRSSVERIGKKYQWIALHELLARLADHAEMRSWWQDDASLYDGPWQIGVREIDPSLLLDSDDRRFDDWEPTWWSPVRFGVPWQRDEKSRGAWLLNEAETPPVHELLEVDDEAGTQYVSLEGHYGWKEEVPPPLGSYETAYASVWLQVRSYLISSERLNAFLEWAQKQRWMGRWMPEAYEMREVFAGEWPWHVSASGLKEDWREIERAEEPPGAVAPTAIQYSWSREGDRALTDSASLLLPSNALVNAMKLQWRPPGFEFVDDEGALVVHDPSALSDGPSVLLARREPLLRTLEDAGVSLFWTILGEKVIIGQPFDPSLPRMEINGFAWINGGGASVQSKIEFPIT